ncbi:MAG: hypothetical protein ACO3FE_15765 [Planctomycetaceae bacterium]
MKIYIAGPNAGKDGVWAGVLFTKGVADVPNSATGVILQLSRYHSAYPEKSKELAESLKIFGQEGFYVGSSLSVSGSGSEGSGDSWEQQAPSTPATDDLSPDASSGSGGAGGVSEGDGHSDTRVDLSKVIQQACLRLDPENKSHWSPTGAPKIVALYSIVKDERITQEAVAQHGLTRMQVASMKDK